MPKFSVIIPVYNGEKSLEKCLDSLATQTFGDFETVIIDDGSKDRSRDICDGYAKKDLRFRVFSQSNSGPSAARNFGISMAEGEYVCFLDCDDSFSQDYFEKMNRLISAEDPDVVFIGYRKLADGKDAEIFVPNIAEGDKIDTVCNLAEKDLFGYTWIKAFRTDKIRGIEFRRDLNLFEDEVFCCEAIKRCERISCLREPVYNYVVGDEGSLTGRTHADYPKKCDAVFSAWKEILAGSKEEYLKKMALRFCERCRYYGFEREVDVKAFFSMLKNCEFFEFAHPKTKLYSYIEAEKYSAVKRKRTIYRLKVKISKLL